MGIRKDGNKKRGMLNQISTPPGLDDYNLLPLDSYYSYLLNHYLAC